MLIRFVNRAFSTGNVLKPFSSAYRLYHHHQTDHHHSSHGTSSYLLQLGHSIETLYEQLPQFFTLKHTRLDTSIYAENIILKDPHYTQHQISGRKWYLQTSKLIKCLAKFYFDPQTIRFHVIKFREFDPQQVALDITDFDDAPSTITFPTDHQPSRPPPPPKPTFPLHAFKEYKLYVRWIFEATPRLSNETSCYEGVFVYVFDEKGYIKEHVILRIHPNPNKINAFNWIMRYRNEPMICYKSD